MSVVSPPPPDGEPPAARRRTVVLAVARPLLTTTALVVVYYLLPVDRRLLGWGLVLLISELCLVVAVIVWQTRLILRANYPTLQGIEALALAVPLYLLVFANVYYLLALEHPGSFTEPLTRTDALYFGVTVLTTVGFGDITPLTQTARALVTGQMVGNLLVLGVALRVILTAIERGRRRKSALDSPEKP
ncbi:potassium channel family protein [Actinophytocola sp.]|uniref:potassium channel family protein n=1 Tax=Actinophytocola sp. TaxID=1872138 RepID=UPI003899BCAC